jgi:putative lipoprotein
MKEVQRKTAMKRILFTLGLCAGLFTLTACASSSLQGDEGDLTGSAWGLSELIDEELVPDSSISVLFTSDGKVGGSSGCNRYSGTYTASGNTIQITSPLASTMMACSQEIMNQESHT